MNYHLRDHIFITQFQDEVILLDAKQDKYIICFKEISQLLISILLKNNIVPSKDCFREKSILDFNSKEALQIPAYLQKLLDDGILESKKEPYPFYIDCKPHSAGAENVDWRLPLENKKIKINIEVIKALLTLIKINLYIKFKGLYQIIQLIRNSRDFQSAYMIPRDVELTNLANVVNKACLLYPKRTKCLEWAITFVLMALKRNWKCNLEIGVQNYPFFAHAWVECDGKVVMDAQDLREGLSIILNEPFRRMRI